MKSLDKALRSVVGQPKATVPRAAVWFLAPATACLAIAASFIAWNSLRDPSGWDDIMNSQVRTDVSMPRLDLAGIGKYESVEIEKCEYRYHFNSNGKKMVLIVSKRRRPSPDAEMVEAGGMTFAKEDGLCWACPSSSYRLIGGTEEDRIRLAPKLAKQTGYVDYGKLNRLGPKQV